MKSTMYAAQSIALGHQGIVVSGAPALAAALGCSHTCIFGSGLPRPSYYSFRHFMSCHLVLLWCFLVIAGGMESMTNAPYYFPGEHTL